MPILALAILATWLVLVVGLRGFLHHRRTGKVPVPPRAAAGSPQMWARLASSLGLILAFAAPIADLLGMDRMDALDQPPIQFVGAVIAVAGIVGAMVSQAAVGDAWRPDVTPGDRTDLVTDGPFRLVRNPVLASTAATAIGLALLVPNVLALAMLACFLLGIQIQVHVVEEPHLLRVHGDAYRRYAARTGRYLPFIGRLRPSK
jgi:protein-S-isoprenylcysteine O-methyltransferase Ste14